MTERLSDDEVAGLALCPGIERLAQEVQASRKLEADLLALHDDSAGWCLHCQQGWPCATVRLVTACSADT